MTTAKLFKNGSSQAVRLPKAFRFEGDEVLISKRGNEVVLKSKLMKKKKQKASAGTKDKKITQKEWNALWKEFFSRSAHCVDDGFLQNIADPPPEKRDLF